MTEQDKIYCSCYRIPYDKLIEIIKQNNCQDYKDVQKYCNAGRACGMCVPYINDYCKKENP